MDDKRDLHHVRVETDDQGIVTGISIDGERVKGCTGITVVTNGAVDFLNVTLSMEAASIEGLAGSVAVTVAPEAPEDEPS